MSKWICRKCAPDITCTLYTKARAGEMVTICPIWTVGADQLPDPIIRADWVRSERKPAAASRPDLPGPAAAQAPAGDPAGPAAAVTPAAVAVSGPAAAVDLGAVLTAERCVMCSILLTARDLIYSRTFFSQPHCEACVKKKVQRGSV